MDAALVQVSETELPEGVTPAWRASSLADVEWCLERLAEVQREEESDAALYEAKKAKLDAWLDAQQAKQEKTRAFFASHIRAYVQQHPEEFRNGKKKSRALPSGTVGFRKVPEKLKVVDADALIAHAKANDLRALIRVKEEPNVAGLKTAYALSGEVLPGCAVEPEREEISFKLGGES